ncbi:hypothetical protein JCM10212_006666 [Sporobolomyces blumeae]
MLLDNTLQPTVLSLFSSTSSHPLVLASEVRCSATATTDSFVSLLDDETNERETLVAFNGGPDELPQRVAALNGVHLASAGEQIRGRVLHLQDPDCRTTSVRWGDHSEAGRRQRGLGIELAHVHLQVKDLGQTFFVDVGVVDDRDEVFVIRCSTFQSAPKAIAKTPSRPALLHVPLVFPAATPSRLTSWSTLVLPLSTHLASLPSFDLPTPGRFASVLSVEVHANCRLRRIWFSHDGKEPDEWMQRKGMMCELALFAAGDTT